MISPVEGWAVGHHGLILHTADGGATWQVQRTGLPEENLYAVQFLDALHGWTVGNGLALYTTDGGATWNRGEGVLGSLQYLGVASLTTGFAGYGDHGGVRVLHKTTDGGRTWSAIDIPFPVARIQFFDSRNGVASGSGGVLRTIDGGATWTVVTTNHGGFFVNPDEGWHIVGQQAEKTTDGGRTWTPLTLPAGTFVRAGANSVFFRDRSNGWAIDHSVTHDRGILRTTDGGRTWTRQQTLSRPLDAAGLHFVDALHGAAVGDCAIYTTEDGGATFTPRVNGPSGGRRITTTDGAHVWVGQRGPEVAFSTDSGETWDWGVLPLGPTATYHVEGLDFANNLTGWVVGGIQPSQIHRTADGGRTYERLPQPHVAADLYDVAALDDSTVIAVGYVPTNHTPWGAVILRSNDGGYTWADVPHPHRSRMFAFRAVHFIDSRTGWAAGDGGLLVKTTDGGLTWEDQRVITGNELKFSDVSFADDLHGWLVGAADFPRNGLVMRTADGGRTWELQNSGWDEQTLTNGGLSAVSAVSSTVAWVSGIGSDGAFIARTVDGGMTWTRERVGPRGHQSFPDVLFVNADNGWTLGPGVYRRGAGPMPAPQPNTAPAVALDQPSPGATYLAPADVTLTAAANDAETSVVGVQFFAGATLVGADDTAPSQRHVAQRSGGHLQSDRSRHRYGRREPVVRSGLDHRQHPYRRRAAGRLADGGRRPRGARRRRRIGVARRRHLDGPGGGGGRRRHRRRVPVRVYVDDR